MLAVGELLLRVRREPRVYNLRHIGVTLQERRDLHRRVGLLTDAQSHRLHSLQYKIGRHRRHDVAVHVLNQLNPLVVLGRLSHEGTTGTNVEAVVVLRQTLDGQVTSMVKWTTDIWRRKSAVADMDQAMLLRDVRDSIQVR